MNVVKQRRQGCLITFNKLSNTEIPHTLRITQSHGGFNYSLYSALPRSACIMKSQKNEDMSNNSLVPNVHTKTKRAVWQKSIESIEMFQIPKLRTIKLKITRTQFWSKSNLLWYYSDIDEDLYHRKYICRVQ